MDPTGNTCVSYGQNGGWAVAGKSAVLSLPRGYTLAAEIGVIDMHF